MELRDYIEEGIAKFGTATELAKELGMNANQVRDAKAHRCGLPNYACIRLAGLIDVEPIAIIAASELATEKREDRKEIFRPFAQMGRLAHPMIVGIVSSATVLGMALDNVLFTSRTFLL